MSDKTRVLFLCTRNSARSQMAEAFLRQYGQDHYEPHSAGLAPGEIDPMTVQVMSERGFDLSGHRAKGIDEYLGKVLFQYLIVMCAEAEKNCPSVWPGLSERLFWPVEDPSASTGSEQERLTAFRTARDRIEAMVKHWVAETGAEN
jgi:arsenate reductase (thioredoxin)